jgi:hypothetical protein
MKELWHVFVFIYQRMRKIMFECFTKDVNLSYDFPFSELLGKFFIFSSYTFSFLFFCNQLQFSFTRFRKINCYFLHKITCFIQMYINKTPGSSFLWSTTIRIIFIIHSLNYKEKKSFLKFLILKGKVIFLFFSFFFWYWKKLLFLEFGIMGIFTTVFWEILRSRLSWKYLRYFNYLFL